MRKTPLLIRCSPLTGQIYALLRYTIRKNGVLVASEKVDVSEQVEQASKERAKFKRRRQRKRQ